MIKTKNKRCSKCKHVLPLTRFTKVKSRKNGYKSACKSCCALEVKQYRSSNRKSYNEKAKTSKQTRKLRDPKYQKREQLRQLYNLSIDDYNDLLKKQNGRCALCKKKPSGGRHKTLCVDHCHTTGKIRGLLCWSCNLGLGMLGDTFDSLSNAVEYLEASK